MQVRGISVRVARRVLFCNCSVIDAQSVARRRRNEDRCALPGLLGHRCAWLPMKIEKVDVIVTSPGRNFVTLKLTTSDGVVGLGDATLNGLRCVAPIGQ